MRRRISRWVLGLVASLACALVSVSGASAQDQPRRGGTLTVITPSDVSTFDPHPAVGFSVRVFANIYEPLFRKDEKGVLHGHLAQSWRFLDPTKLQITLRKGVKFHSGNEFTAEDVKFTYERQLNPADLARDAAVIKMLKTPIQVVDRYTLVLETREPNAALVDTLAQSLATLIPDSAEIKKWGKDYGLHPSGTGPFKFVEWVRGQHVKLARNADYWNGPPYLDFLVFKVVPEEATRVLALESGEADVLFETPPSAIATLRKNPKLRVNRVPTYRDVNVHWNAMKAPTDDVRLRRALSQAIDVEEHRRGGHHGRHRPGGDRDLQPERVRRVRRRLSRLQPRAGQAGLRRARLPAGQGRHPREGRPAAHADAGGEPAARPAQRGGGRGDPGPAPGGRRRHEGERQRVRHLHEDPAEPRRRLQHDLPRVRRGDGGRRPEGDLLPQHEPRRPPGRTAPGSRAPSSTA